MKPNAAVNRIENRMSWVSGYTDRKDIIMAHVYRTEFHLTNPVKNFKEAMLYLIRDDMTKYLLCDDRGCNKVENVRWQLTEDDEGYIEVIASESLSDEESANISSWIRGQCSDGLGEGFEQQDFACYCDGDYDPYYDDYDECAVIASFDWESNMYALEEV